MINAEHRSREWRRGDRNDPPSPVHHISRGERLVFRQRCGSQLPKKTFGIVSDRKMVDEIMPMRSPISRLPFCDRALPMFKILVDGPPSRSA